MLRRPRRTSTPHSRDRVGARLDGELPCVEAGDRPCKSEHRALFGEKERDMVAPLSGEIAQFGYEGCRACRRDG